MSAAISPATSQSYGVQRVCRIWGLPRSSFYHATRGVPAARRGPVPPVADDSLLAVIRADLAASPLRGEGHRKVWARLRYGLGRASTRARVGVGRNRVLWLMREKQLLSPYRQPPRPANDHNGTILTTAPDRLWGTDASMVQTVADGPVWVFAALEPVSQAVTARFGGIEADAARGVTVRADNGPQYISRHFTRQRAHWGMALSPSFPHQPETNGVAERFFRTLKEQVIYGQIFHPAAEVRTAVATFVTRYNASWRLARLGYMSPLDYRLRHAAAATSVMAA
jgi:transposase InsO family protein